MNVTKKHKKNSAATTRKRPARVTRIAGKKVKPKAFAKSRIRPIGNSRGVILSNQLIEAAGLNTEADIIIQAADGVIYILQLKTPAVNTDISTWDKQFKAAIKKGASPEGDFFEGMTNDFDLNEW